MVEILGKDSTKYIQKSCENCASILKFTKSECEYHKYSCMGDIDFWFGIRCPCCNHAIEAKP